MKTLLDTQVLCKRSVLVRPCGSEAKQAEMGTVLCTKDRARSFTDVQTKNGQESSTIEKYDDFVDNKWCRGAVVQWLSMRTHNTGAVSSIPQCANFKNAIGEEGNGKPPHEFHFPRKTQSPASGFCYARNRVRNAVFFKKTCSYLNARNKSLAVKKKQK